MLTEAKKIDLERQGYRVVGNHSAIKVCLWCKQAIRGKGFCYKEKFYGINSNQCVQMTPALHTCSHRCQYCWRDINFTSPEWVGEVDDPKSIVEGCVREHVEFLKGFKGNSAVDKEKLDSAFAPKHFAISLSGEPCMYPKLPELISDIRSRGMTSFLVTNGTQSDMVARLLDNQPTQMYVTLPAPDEETYLEVCQPIENGWNNIMKSLSLLSGFDRSVVRLTLAKGLNMIHASKYAELFKQIDADYFELKAYMHVGVSKFRMEIGNMPYHPEIVSFAEEVIKHYPELKIIDEKSESRVVLLGREDKKDRVMKFS